MVVRCPQGTFDRTSATEEHAGAHTDTYNYTILTRFCNVGWLWLLFAVLFFSVMMMMIVLFICLAICDRVSCGHEDITSEQIRMTNRRADEADEDISVVLTIEKVEQPHDSHHEQYPIPQPTQFTNTQDRTVTMRQLWHRNDITSAREFCSVIISKCIATYVNYGWDPGGNVIGRDDGKGNLTCDIDIRLSKTTKVSTDLQIKPRYHFNASTIEAHVKGSCGYVKLYSMSVLQWHYHCEYLRTAR